jgi:hypothetical protein
MRGRVGVVASEKKRTVTEHDELLALREHLAVAEAERDGLRTPLLLRVAKRRRFAFINATKGRWPVVVQCTLLGVTTGGFYAFVSPRRSVPVALPDERLLAMIRRIFRDSGGAFGSPRIHRELKEKHKVRVSERRVARLMREQRISATLRNDSIATASDGGPTSTGARPFATASEIAGSGVARDGGLTSTGAPPLHKDADAI